MSYNPKGGHGYGNNRKGRSGFRGSHKPVKEIESERSGILGYVHDKEIHRLGSFLGS